MQVNDGVASKRMKYTCGICTRQRQRGTRERQGDGTPENEFCQLHAFKIQCVHNVCRVVHFTVCYCILFAPVITAVCMALLSCVCLVFIKFSLYKFCGNYLAGCEFFLLFMCLFRMNGPAQLIHIHAAEHT